MNAKPSRAKIVVISALGTALVLPLFLAPASAAMDGSHFFVHAQDTDTPKPHEATAGLGGSKAGDGSTGGDSTAALATYTAGPVSLKITQAMLDFSKANVKAQEEGRTGDIKTDPEGWQTVWFMDSDGNYTQNPIGVNATGTAFLSKTVATPNSWEATSENPDFVAYYNRVGGNAEVYDSRVPKSADVTFYYKKASGGSSGGTSISEGRYISEGGEIIAATVSTGPGGYDVKRRTSATDRTAPANDDKPYNVTQSGNQVEVRLKGTVDGYDQILISGDQVRYGVWNGADAYGNQDVADANRKNGPVLAYINGDGSFSALMYADSSGTMQFLDGSEAPVTLASYNGASGQNWDGKLPKVSDFDISKPFEPKS